MTERVALCKGVWQDLSTVSLSLDDWGHLQGATLVERLRTVAGKPLDAEEHLTRLRESASLLGIAWPDALSVLTIDECVQRNRKAHAAPDFSIVILLTPGRLGVGSVGERPTWIVHSTDLNWPALAHWYSHGQVLITSDFRNVPAQCWPATIKTRSRLHYFLADQQAHASGKPHAGAAMLSIDGHLTETSVANILLVDDQGLISPPVDSVLHGISLRRTLRLAGDFGLSVRFEPITPNLINSAREILITGSSGCLWPAAQLNDRCFANPTEGIVFKLLNEAWNRDLGLDYAAQAHEVCESMRAVQADSGRSAGPSKV